MAENKIDHPNINKNIHPPIVALFYIVFAMVLQRFIPIPFHVDISVRYVGLVLTFIGLMLGAGAFIEFRKARTTLDPHGAVKALVIGGVYRFTRNPIYAGFLFMVIGFPLNYDSLWGIVCAPFFVITMNRLVIEREEAYLEKRFGEAYTSYKSRVRRWL